MKAETEQKIAYYTFKSQQMKSLFPQERHGDDDLQFLLYQLNRIQDLLTPLQKPWGRYIPMIHSGFSKPGESSNHSLEIIKLMVNMLEHGAILDRMIKMNKIEMEELKELIKKRKF